MQQAHRPVPLHVAELMVTAMGQHKHAVLLPLKAFPGAAVVIPDGGETAAINHVHDLVQRKLQWARGLTGGNLGDACRTHALLAHQLDKSAHTLALFPPAEFRVSEILDEKAS